MQRSFKEILLHFFLHKEELIIFIDIEVVILSLLRNTISFFFQLELTLYLEPQSLYQGAHSQLLTTFIYQDED